MANNLTPKEEFLLNPVTEHNITDAAIASFETNLKHPVKVTVPITPQQDLHGYDNPWPAGGGANIWDEEWEVGLIDASSGQNTSNNSYSRTKNYVPVDANTSYWLVIPTGNKLYLRFYDSNKNYLGYAQRNSSSEIVPSESVYSGTAFIRFCWDGQTYNHDIAVNYPSTVHTYSPYSNECPISGWTGCKVTRASENIYGGGQLKDDFSAIGGTVDTTAKTVKTSASQMSEKTFFAKFKENTRYTFIITAKKESGTSKSLNLVVRYTDGTGDSPLLGEDVLSKQTIVFKTSSNKTISSFGGAWGSGATFYYYEECGVFEDDITADDFEPYQATTIPINWQSSAGTIYGGTVTLNEDGSADVVATMAKTVFNGTQAISNVNWMPNATSVGWLYSNSLTPGIKVITSSTNIPNIVSNVLPTVNYEIVYGGTTDCISEVPNSSTFGIAMRSTDTSLTTQTAINAYLTQHPVEVIYELATPLTYHFPNVGQLKAFLGANNVWSDAGNVNVKYLTQNSATGLEYRGDRALELRRRAMIGDAPTIHTTVGSEETGGLASFKSYIKAPVNKIEIPFGPKQDLHGYDAPWPAGGGKNLYNPDNRTETSDNTYYITELLANTQYTFSVDVTQDGLYAAGYNNGVLESITAAYNSTVLSFNTGEYTLIRLMTYKTSSKSFPTKYQLELGSTATAYAPYENVCPIEAWDGANIEQREKNLFDSSTLAQLSGVVVNEDGSVYVANNNSIYDKVAWRNTKDYIGQIAITYRYKYANAGAVGAFPKIVYTDGTTQGPGPSNSQTFVDHTFVSNSNKQVDYVTFSYGTGDNSTTFFLQIEIGSVATDYESYHAQTLPITFNQSGDHEFLPIQEGTGDPSPENVRPIHPGLTFTRDDDSVLSVYGGTLTVNSDGTGSLASAQNKIILNGTEAWQMEVEKSPYSVKFKYYIDDMYSTYNSSKGLTSYISRFTSESDTFADGKLCCQHGLYDRFFFVFNAIENIDEVTDLNSWKEYLSRNPLEVVYPIATPTTYTLSVTETNRALEALGLIQHIGPIYGGTVTINPDGSADVVADMGSAIITSAPSYPYRQLYSAFFVPTPTMASGNGMNGYASWLPTTINQEKDYPSIQFGWNDSPNRCYLWRIGYVVANSLGVDVSVVTSTQVNQYLTEHPLQIVYLLATPQTYHFSNLEQLKVWLGENNFWCDISDDITVKYWNRG